MGTVQIPSFYRIWKLSYFGLVETWEKDDTHWLTRQFSEHSYLLKLSEWTWWSWGWDQEVNNLTSFYHLWLVVQLCSEIESLRNQNVNPNCFSGEGGGGTRYAVMTRECAGTSSDTQPWYPTWPHLSLSSEATNPLDLWALSVTLGSLSHFQVQDGGSVSPTEPPVLCSAQNLFKHGGYKASLSLRVRGPLRHVVIAGGGGWLVWKTKTCMKIQNTLGPKKRQPLFLDRTTRPHEDVTSSLVNILMLKSISIKASFVSGSGQDDSKVHTEK